MHLSRIERDAAGIPVKLYLFTRPPSADAPKVIAINPYVAFGRPVVMGTGIPTAIIAERYKAGESIEDLALRLWPRVAGHPRSNPVRTRSPSRLEPLVFFLDRNLGKHTIADALRQAGAEVQIHDDHFRQETPDEEWLREVGQRSWIVLTKDTQIRYRAHERAALRQAGVRAFVLVAKEPLWT